MTDLLTSDDKCPDLSYNQDYRWYLITRTESPAGYRFGRAHGKRLRVRTALSGVNGYLKNMIEAIANAKLRRLRRRLELRGVRYDRPSESLVDRKSQPAEHSR
jgi:hypothetical protein